MEEKIRSETRSLKRLQYLDLAKALECFAFLLDILLFPCVLG